ncbi:unnamed protein product [Mytilus edulis]|uniref:Uncharacterized protein n=1 Tax=Mytilus edulis TaxID=6550 RepID=A0A8S3VSB8_MYTED|nr:unnamed protein product [Mytilus edulis]
MLTSIILVFVATGYVIAESSCHTTDGKYTVLPYPRQNLYQTRQYEVSVIDRSVGKKIPQVIAFYAYKTKNVNPGAGRRLVFEKTMTNDETATTVILSIYMSQNRNLRIYLGHPHVSFRAFHRTDDKQYHLRDHIPTCQRRRRRNSQWYHCVSSPPEIGY